MAKHRHKDSRRFGWRASWPYRWFPGRRSEPDPFQTLALQLRLARLSGEIAGLQRDERQFAKAHHLQAALAAYDNVLDQACRLAGVEVDRTATDAVNRLLAEAALREQGWTW